jgi:hypothetical protein
MERCALEREAVGVSDRVALRVCVAAGAADSSPSGCPSGAGVCVTVGDRDRDGAAADAAGDSAADGVTGVRLTLGGRDAHVDRDALAALDVCATDCDGDGGDDADAVMDPATSRRISCGRSALLENEPS